MTPFAFLRHVDWARVRDVAIVQTGSAHRLPAVIERLEAEIAGIHAEMATDGYFRRPGDALAADKTRLDDAERRLAEGYARWEALDGGA